MVVENFKSFFVIAIFFKTFSLKISLFYFFEFEKSFFTGKDLTRIVFLNIKWSAARLPDGRCLYAAPCGIRAKWSSWWVITDDAPNFSFTFFVRSESDHQTWKNTWTFILSAAILMQHKLGLIWTYCNARKCCCEADNGEQFHFLWFLKSQFINEWKLS